MSMSVQFEKIKVYLQIAFAFSIVLNARANDPFTGSGNRDVHVRSSTIERGKRLVPLHVSVDEEIESSHLKFLVTPPPGTNAIKRYCQN